MAFFSDPIPCDHPARRAVTLALGMRDRAAAADHLGDIEFKGIARLVPTYLVQSLAG